MDQYSNYIRKLRQTALKADFSALYQKIETKKSKRSRQAFSRPLIGLAVVAMLFIFMFPFLPNRNQSIVAGSRFSTYGFQHERSGDHIVAEYVLGE